MQARALGITQGALVPGGTPCSVIAVLIGNALLRAAPGALDAAALDHCVRIGCTAWALLTAPQRKRATDDSTLTAAEVLDSLVATVTYAAPWRAEAELTGLHLRAGVEVPPAAREFLRATATAADSIVEFATADSLAAALQTAAARAATTGRSLAATVTHAGHTVVVVFVHDDYGTIVHAVDSLSGEWLIADETAASDLLARVATDWCAPADTVDAAQFSVNIFGRHAPAPPPEY